MDSYRHSGRELAPEPESAKSGAEILASSPLPAPAPAGPKRGIWLWLFLIALVASGWFFRDKWLPYVKNLTGSRAAPQGRSGRGPVPVVTATARTRDINVYLNGLGTVTAFQSVTMRSRVEGELIKVNFTEGEMVKEGDVLAEIDPRPYEVQLKQAQGQLMRDEATHTAGELTLKRYKQLLTTKTITAQEVDEQTAVVQQSAGTIETDRGLVDNAKLQLTYCKITAPISGRIGLRLVDRGNIVRANDVNGLAVITQLQPISLVFSIPQDEIVRLQSKLNAGKTLTCLAHDRDLKVKIATGTLGAIDNQVDPMTGTVKLKAVFDNKDNALFPNQFVNARLLLDTIKGAIVVPTAAIQRGPNGSFVYIVKDDSTVDVRMIEVGQAEGTDSEIKKGLAVGDVVVTEGLDKLQPKAKVALREKNR
ncbi:MAG: MdtA/MuxA family multidrug efflux RND transporter periplasmic adaptor subunit [Planctomycetales bacterium]